MRIVVDNQKTKAIEIDANHTILGAANALASAVQDQA
jgi:hypothetical protein